MSSNLSTPPLTVAEKSRHQASLARALSLHKVKIDVLEKEIQEEILSKIAQYIISLELDCNTTIEKLLDNGTLF